MKLVKVSMPDGSEWGIPFIVVAYDRARSIIEHDLGYTPSDPDYFKKFEEEVQYTLNHEDSAVTWADCNMSWSDVENMAFCLKKPTQNDYHKGWELAGKTIVNSQ